MQVRYRRRAELPEQAHLYVRAAAETASYLMSLPHLHYQKQVARLHGEIVPVDGAVRFHGNALALRGGDGLDWRAYTCGGGQAEGGHPKSHFTRDLVTVSTTANIPQTDVDKPPHLSRAPELELVKPAP